MAQGGVLTHELFGLTHRLADAGEPLLQEPQIYVAQGADPSRRYGGTMSARSRLQALRPGLAAGAALLTLAMFMTILIAEHFLQPGAGSGSASGAIWPASRVTDLHC